MKALCTLLLALGTIAGWLTVHPAASWACSGLRSTGNSATATMRPNRVSISIVVQNTSSTACRVFAFDDTTAVDNAGNSWLARPSSSYIAGVYACDSRSYCLTRDQVRTETSATIIEAKQSAVVTIAFAGAARDKKFGDLVSVGFVLMGQTVKEEATPSGVKLVGGPWRSISVGVANLSLKSY
jgi:hypothetical protein